MKYAAYKEYKISPMAWLDQLPTHWSAASLRWVSKRYAGGTPDKGNEAYWEDGEIPWINSGAVNDGYITQPSELITRDGFANSSAKWIPKDALVMALAGQGKTKGMVAQLGIPTTCNQSMAALIPNYRFEPRYLYYWLTANYQNIRNLAGGEARDGLNLEMLGSIPCPVPPIDEQQTIARFLDAKTAQIDALVAQKRQIIDKLKEKRSALIARTVTRGLPPEAAKAAGLEPNPEMKDSGVDWLGEVVCHWSVKRLRFLLVERLRYGANEAAELDDPDFPRFVRITDVDDDGRLRPETFRSLPVEVAKPYLLQDGDVLFARSGATSGKTFLYEESWGVCAYAGYLIRARIDQRQMQPRFLRFFTSSANYWQWVSLAFIQATIQNISAEKYADLWIPVPPLHEQVAIVEYLSSKTSELDDLIVQAVTVIDRLTEYRQALITSAVTGKIDVRIWAETQEAA
ncbi:MAG: restriction endonuclease subunit S [Acidithiobacillus sp.]